MEKFRKLLSTMLFRAILIPSILIPLVAQEPPTVAVLDFEGRGISIMEAQTLTDRLLTEIGNTGTVRLVERNAMQEILEEQGFQQSGCTSDECAAEVGALLGVQFMISGAIGKIGETYTIDAKMFSVETGESIRTKNVSYQGPVDGLITEIEILGWEIIGLEAPEELKEKKRLGTKAFLSKQMGTEKSKVGAMIRSLVLPGFGQVYSDKKIWGIGWMSTELALGGLTLMALSKYNTAFDDYTKNHDLYTNETDPDLIVQYKSKARKNEDDANSARDQVKMFSNLVVGVWVLNAIHAYLVGPKEEEKKDVGHLPNPAFRLVYYPEINQTRVRWEIAL